MKGGGVGTSSSIKQPIILYYWKVDMNGSVWKYMETIRAQFRLGFRGTMNAF